MAVASYHSVLVLHMWYAVTLDLEHNSMGPPKGHNFMCSGIGNFILKIKQLLSPHWKDSITIRKLLTRFAVSGQFGSAKNLTERYFKIKSLNCHKSFSSSSWQSRSTYWKTTLRNQNLKGSQETQIFNGQLVWSKPRPKRRRGGPGSVGFISASKL